MLTQPVIIIEPRIYYYYVFHYHILVGYAAGEITHLTTHAYSEANCSKPVGLVIKAGLNISW